MQAVVHSELELLLYLTVRVVVVSHQGIVGCCHSGSRYLCTMTFGSR
jgi:hypothetical protein